jgi:GntR family transcriptional regulator, transcriptional repressor for pyruvate dehydrogenase complex
MAGLDVQGLRVPKASDVLADRLRQQILDGDLVVGQLLPPERILSERSGMSRTVVREALRILEIEGLVEIRPGRNGGSVVRIPDVGSFARSLDIFIRGRRVRFDDVLEARELFEPMAAKLAATRRTDADLEVLEAATAAVEAAIDDVPTFLTANVNWHVTVAGLSHNELLAAFMQAMATAVRAATDVENFNSRATMEHALHAHRRIVSAIAKGDGERAYASMRRHVVAYESLVHTVPVLVELELAGNSVPRSPINGRQAKN